ncbi:glycosyltransferase [Pectobacterium versatile]|uniref:glycosyltransferase n=1 Tax=Pectobacterium versatile TaxID=2488639 RepID=UPI001F3ED263|nr:glycosyltransferase [Pectobacterium versatile]
MTSDSKFSVLMSIYKNETPGNFDESLASLFGQKLKPDEVVVVIDGPVENSIFDVINKWMNSLNLVVCTLEENVGLGNALNAGLNICKYELVARMDTDDISEPERFFKQITHMCNNTNVSLLGSNVEEYDKKMEVSLGIKKVPIPYSEVVTFSKKRNPFNHMSVVFKKSAIVSVGGYQDHKFMEDYNLWLRVIAAGYCVENLPDTLLKVRFDQESIYRRSGLSYILSEIKLFKLKYKLKSQPITPLLITFFIRCIPRILPSFLLSKIYKFNRRNTLKGMG